MLLMLVTRGKTSSPCTIIFPIYLKRNGFCKQLLSNLFVINKRFLGQIFLLGKSEFTERLLLRVYTGVVNNPSSTKLSYSKWKNAVLNPSKFFLALRKSTLGFCRLSKDRSLEKWDYIILYYIILYYIILYYIYYYNYFSRLPKNVSEDLVF